MAKRVLIVDDAMIMRMRIKEIAKESGWDVAGEATNGEDAIARFQELRPDLMTLDIVMPKMDGVAALRSIKQTDPGARIVMVSAVDQKEKLTECIRLGAVDFIVKPFDKASLKCFFEKMGREVSALATRSASSAAPNPPIAVSES
ncbi:MAG: response regulator [Planctomycetaceae bacterium]